MSAQSSAFRCHSHSADIRCSAALEVVLEAAHSPDCTGEAAVRRADPGSMRPEAAGAVRRLHSSRQLDPGKSFRQVMTALMKQTSRDDGRRAIRREV